MLDGQDKTREIHLVERNISISDESKKKILKASKTVLKQQLTVVLNSQNQNEIGSQGSSRGDRGYLDRFSFDNDNS